MLSNSLSDGYRRRKSRSVRMAKKSRSRRVKRGSQKIKRSRSRKVKRSRSRSRKVKRSRSRKVKRSRSRKVKRSRSARRSKSRRRLTPEEKLMRKAKVISKALENCKKYGMNSEECLRTMRVISKPARDNIREIIRKLDEQKMKVMTSGPSLRPTNLDLIRRIRQGPSPTSGGMVKCNMIVGRWLNSSSGARTQDEYITFVTDQNRLNNLSKSEIDFCLEQLNAVTRYKLAFDPKKVEVTFKSADKTALYSEFIKMRKSGVPAGAIVLKMKARGFSDADIKKFEAEEQQLSLIQSQLEKNSKTILDKLGLGGYSSASAFIGNISSFLTEEQKKEVIAADDTKVAELVAKYVSKEEIAKFKDAIECTNKDTIEEIKEAFPTRVITLRSAKALWAVFPERMLKKCKFVMDEAPFNELLKKSGFKIVAGETELKTELEKLVKSGKIPQKIADGAIEFDKYTPIQQATLLKGFEVEGDEFNKKFNNDYFNKLKPEDQDKLLKELNVTKTDKGYNWKLILGVTGAVAAVTAVGYLVYTGQLTNPIPDTWMTKLGETIEVGKNYTYNVWESVPSFTTITSSISDYSTNATSALSGWAKSIAPTVILTNIGSYFGYNATATPTPTTGGS